eukprot:jgi/Tetstr1/434731/TSEL_023783.t1
MEAAAAGQQTSPRSLLVEATEAHDALVGLLPAPALAALACTCRDLRHAAAHSPAAAARWRGLAEEALGRSAAAMHEALLRPAGKEGAAGAPPDGGVASAKANNPFAARAAFWRSLCRSAATCEELHWSDTGAARLWSCVDTPRRETHAQVSSSSGEEGGEGAAQCDPEAGPSSEAEADARQLEQEQRRRLRAQLARSGHTSTLLDEMGLLVVVGGLMDDEGEEAEAAHGENGNTPISVLIVGLPSIQVSAPVVEGPQPGAPARYRHAAARVPLRALGPREVAALAGPQGSADDFTSGAVVALHGGYHGSTVYGGLLLLWVGPGGARVRWAEAETLGDPPPACFHHAMLPLRRSPVLLLVGGETRDAHLPGGVVYSLWLPTMTWESKPTLPAPGQDDEGEDGASPVPGPLWLHVAALRPDSPGRPEEVVVLCGVTPGGLGSTAPRVLDTEAMKWRWAPPHPPAQMAPGDPWDGPEQAQLTDSAPRGRHRTAATVVGRFLVLHGGCPARGAWLKDTWLLDLVSLTWRPGPAAVEGRPRWHVAIAGHTLEGLVAFGGCSRGIFGITPVAKMDVLLLGPKPPADPAEGEEAGPAASGGGGAAPCRRRGRGPLAGMEVLGQVTLQGEVMQVLRHPRHGGLAVPLTLYEAMLEDTEMPGWGWRAWVPTDEYGKQAMLRDRRAEVEQYDNHVYVGEVQFFLE